MLAYTIMTSRRYDVKHVDVFAHVYFRAKTARVRVMRVNHLFTRVYLRERDEAPIMRARDSATSMRTCRCVIYADAYVQAQTRRRNMS